MFLYIESPHSCFFFFFWFHSILVYYYIMVYHGLFKQFTGFNNLGYFNFFVCLTNNTMMNILNICLFIHLQVYL